jgi:hypothetical protein
MSKQAEQIQAELIEMESQAYIPSVKAKISIIKLHIDDLLKYLKSHPCTQSIK